MLGSLKRTRPADLLSAMGNHHRLTILSLILDTEVSVGDLSTRVGLSQSALSQHLAKLRSLNLVDTRRNAQTVYYSTRHPGVRRLLECLNTMSEAPADRSGTS